MTASGSRVRSGVLFRSEAVLDPDPADALALTNLRFALICDLRGASERIRAPNNWWRAQGVRLIDLDILADIRGSTDIWDALRVDVTVVGAVGVMERVYRDLPDAAAAHLGTIARQVAAGNLPLLIHCTAGKDRTGFLVAALLRLLGVPDGAIMTDYLASAGRLNAAVTDATRALVLDHVGNILSEQALEALTGVNSRYLTASFATIDKSYGDFNSYLQQAANIDVELADAVRSQLLDVQ